jgi:hypothetical protein
VGEKNRLKESSGQLGSKTRRFCPSEAKAARFQASLSSPCRRGTMPAQPSNGFFSQAAFARQDYLSLGQKLRVFRAHWPEPRSDITLLLLFPFYIPSLWDNRYFLVRA